MLRQAVQSPDMNILYLGLFYSMKMRNNREFEQVNTVAKLCVSKLLLVPGVQHILYLILWNSVVIRFT